MKEINDQDLERYLNAATELARAKAKAAGTSVVYEENGKMVREFADGRKTQVIYDEHGHRTEVEYEGN